MTLAEFIMLFDKKAVEDGKISFCFHEPKGGKWHIWCEKQLSNTQQDLVDFVKKNKCLNDKEIDGFQEVRIEPSLSDVDGVKITLLF